MPLYQVLSLKHHSPYMEKIVNSGTVHQRGMLFKLDRGKKLSPVKTDPIPTFFATRCNEWCYFVQSVTARKIEINERSSIK